jgi:hypothetical protein
MKKDRFNITGDFRSFQTGTIFIGGASNENYIHRTIRKNYIGCLRNVCFSFYINI